MPNNIENFGIENIPENNPEKKRQLIKGRYGKDIAAVFGIISKENNQLNSEQVEE